MMAQWYRQTADAVQKELNTDATQGLSSAEAAARLQQVGPNELIERGGGTPWQILWEQLTATMVLVLLAGGVVAAVLQKGQEGGAQPVICLVLSILGFFQGRILFL